MEPNPASELIDPIASSGIRARKKTAFERTVLDALGKMKRGRLQVQLPTGENLIFGSPVPDDGIHAEIRLRSADFFKRCIFFGPIGFAESYIAGEWETGSIAHVIAWFLLNSENSSVLDGSAKKARSIDLFQITNRLMHLTRSNTRSNSRRNISEHYDLSNEFFALWLDPSMTYSSAIFESAEQPLEEAQTAKYERLCQELQIRETDHVLEIGCGWGGFALHAAKTRGCKVTGLTISQKQFEMARQRVADAGLDGQIEIVLQDYRDLTGRFDKIVSIEMLEAVGDRYLESYFSKCAEVLKPAGLLGLQVITCPDCRFVQLRDGVDFIQKHIFPGSLLISVSRILKALHSTSSFSLFNMKDLGEHYAKTLHLWHQRFTEVREEVIALGFDETFLRKWAYYLCYCEAAFAMREISVAQIVLTRPNNASLLAPLVY